MATNPEPSLMDVLVAIKSLDYKVDNFGKQLKENTEMVASIVQRVEMNTVDITDCKSKLDELEKKHSALEKENADLKEKVLEVERYKRRWNLRLLGLKEQDGENIREKIQELLLQLFPQWKEEIAGVVDSVHRTGRREEGGIRQVILQFVRRLHRDEIWKIFVQDFTKEDHQARELLWPKIKQARSLGKMAYYKGHITVIDGRTVKA